MFLDTCVSTTCHWHADRLVKTVPRPGALKIAWRSYRAILYVSTTPTDELTIELVAPGAADVDSGHGPIARSWYVRREQAECVERGIFEGPGCDGTIGRLFRLYDLRAALYRGTEMTVIACCPESLSLRDTPTETTSVQRWVLRAERYD